MRIYVHDTKSRKKRLFKPQNPDQVTIYVCGPTVYDRLHIGNGRSAVVFDVFVRLLRATYDKVTFVRNITDIDDKINDAARAANEPIELLTQRYTKTMYEDFVGLDVLPPDVEPCATDHIPQIIAIISKLIDLDFAYESANHVLFHVPRDPNYGTLANRSLDDMIDGARVEVAPYKRDAKDFVLWKPSIEPPGWDSPWGFGRPGWHIECTAMIHTHLGLTIDIHGGGNDLAFPHHENEMAQGTCATHNEEYVRYWMHNGMLNFGAQKMSKSLGNIVTIQNLLRKHGGEVLRYALLSGHYRQSLNWDEKLLEQAERSVETLYHALRTVNRTIGEGNIAASTYVDAALDDFPAEVVEPLADDMNTPRALAAMHALAAKTHQTQDEKELKRCREQLLAGGWLLGLLGRSVDEYFHGIENPQIVAVIESLISQRLEARRNRNFELADSIRNQLALQHSIAIEDTPRGTEWKKIKSSQSDD